jgi:hypothetical protein
LRGGIGIELIFCQIAVVLRWGGGIIKKYAIIVAAIVSISGATKD